MNKRLIVISIALMLNACSKSGSSDEPMVPQTPVNAPATFSGELTGEILVNQSVFSGTLNVIDSDAGEAMAIAQTGTAGTYGTFTLAVNGAWTYTIDPQNQAFIALPEDAELSDTFSISSSDNTTSQVTITLKGINEAATFTQGDGVNQASVNNQETEAIDGTITVSDADTGESAFIPLNNIISTYGTFSIDAAGMWSYTLDTSNTIVMDLSVGEMLGDAINISSIDGTSTAVNITIVGTDQQASNGLTKGSIGDNDTVPSVNCTTTHNSTSSLENAVSFAMTAGETHCLAAGNYSGLELTFGGSGTAQMPITVAAEQPGSVTINGEVFIGMTGSYAVLQGFVFTDGTIDNSLLQTRANSNTACNNCRITENVFVNMDAGITDSTKWFQIYGTGNRFDHNWVSGKTTRGALFVIERGDAPGTEDRTQIDHNYFGDRPPKDGLAYAQGSDNEYEGIRVGSSSTHTSDSFAVIEHNYFEAIDGEAEVISIKAGNVTVRHNTVRNSRGSIVNRHGEGAIIDNNFIIGDGNPFSGGIRVVDADHSITNNYIEGARYLRTNFNGGILVSNSDGSTSNGYQDVENVLVANNTVVDSVNSINLYAGSRSDRPDSVYFVNNVVDNAIGPVIRNAGTLPTNSNYAGNYVHGASFADDDVTSLDGFSFVDPMLETASLNGTQAILRPSASSPSLLADTSATIGEFTLPSLDVDGQMRTDMSVSGADELVDEEPMSTALRGILSPNLVGPISYDAPQPSLSIMAVNINNAKFDNGDLSGWTVTNANFVDDTDKAFSGNTSAEVMGPTSAITQSVAVQANTNYTLSAFIAGKGQLQAQVGAQEFKTDNTSSNGALNYVFNSVSFNSGGNTSINIIAKVDDSVINEVAINNASFASNQDGWVVNEGTGIGQVQDSSNAADGDDGSIKFTHNDADSGTPYQPYIAQTVSVEANTEYTLQMYVLLKSNDEQDATVRFGVHTGQAIQNDVFDDASIIASKNSVYADLAVDSNAEDSFRPDTIVFNSGDNTSITIFAQYQSVLGDDIRIDQFSLSSSGAPANDTRATFDDFRLVSHPSL
jgi:poly(beta-D-mannuronate) lyase